MMRHIWFLWIALAGCACSAGRVSHNHAMHPDWQVAFVQEQVGQGQEPYASAYALLLHCADSVQGQGQHALADFSVPGFYVKPEEHRANSLAIQQDAFAAYCCALAYRLSDERRYGEKALYFLNAWASFGVFRKVI